MLLRALLNCFSRCLVSNLHIFVCFVNHPLREILTRRFKPLGLSVSSWKMAGCVHHPGGLWEQCHRHEHQRQPLLPDRLSGLWPGRPGGLCLHPGTESPRNSGTCGHILFEVFLHIPTQYVILCRTGIAKLFCWLKPFFCWPHSEKFKLPRANTKFRPLVSNERMTTFFDQKTYRPLKNLFAAVLCRGNMFMLPC